MVSIIYKTIQTSEIGLYMFKITIIINIGNSLFKERVIQSSQQCSVGWEDPTEQQEKARVCVLIFKKCLKYQ